MEQILEMYRKLPIKLRLVLLLLATAASTAYSYYESVEPAFAAHKAALDEMATLEAELESLNKAGQSTIYGVGVGYRLR